MGHGKKSYSNGLKSEFEPKTECLNECHLECHPECHPECQDQLDMVRSHTVMV